MCVCFKRHIGIVQVGRVVHWWAKMKTFIKLRFVKCMKSACVAVMCGRIFLEHNFFCNTQY